MTKVVLVGDLYYSDLSIGGGPIVPPGGGGGGQPGYPSHPIYNPGAHPEHPIPPTVWPNPPGQGGGGQPPGYWGGTPPTWIDNTLPGQPPGIWGGAPPWLDNTLPGGGKPPGHVSGGPGSLPEHIMPPIWIEPGAPPVDPPADPVIEWHSGWSAEKGWVTVGIITPEAPIPTPSS
jgi:hypothetical protein